MLICVILLVHLLKELASPCYRHRPSDSAGRAKPHHINNSQRWQCIKVV